MLSGSECLELEFCSNVGRQGQNDPLDVMPTEQLLCGRIINRHVKPLGCLFGRCTRHICNRNDFYVRNIGSILQMNLTHDAAADDPYFDFRHTDSSPFIYREEDTRNTLTTASWLYIISGIAPFLLIAT